MNVVQLVGATYQLCLMSVIDSLRFFLARLIHVTLRYIRLAVTKLRQRIVGEKLGIPRLIILTEEGRLSNFSSANMCASCERIHFTVSFCISAADTV